MDQFQQLYEDMLKVDGGQIIISANRDPEKVAEQDAESGLPSFISHEAFDFMGQQFLGWLATRFIRGGKTVTDVEVEVKLRFDGEEVGGTITLPYRPEPVIDGGHRGGRG